jgi:purine-binding chemotaxis protein CheW
MRRSPHGAHAAHERSLVVFTVGTVRYATRIEEVREIIAPIDLTVLPHMPAGVAGVCDHREEVVPIVDLRAVFGLGKNDRPKKTKWVIVDAVGCAVGLAVDDVTGVVRVDSGGFRSPPDLGGGARARSISSVTTHDGQMLFLIDVSQFEKLARGVDRPTIPPAGPGGGA